MINLTWDIINIIAIVAYAFTGALVALQEKYDIFGVYILGLAASFGGGITRNLLVGVPVKPFWEQGFLFTASLIAITIIYLMPKDWIKSWNKWNDFYDAIGLAAFTIQGSIFAVQLNLPLSGVILCAVLTGVGGGVIRDVLARRKPMVFHREVYALWGVIVGFVIFYQWVDILNSIQLFTLLFFVTLFRMVSLRYKWHVNFRSLEDNLRIHLFPKLRKQKDA